jgi:ribosomal protein L7/L12
MYFVIFGKKISITITEAYPYLVEAKPLNAYERIKKSCQKWNISKKLIVKTIKEAATVYAKNPPYPSHNGVTSLKIATIKAVRNLQRTNNEDGSYNCWIGLKEAKELVEYFDYKLRIFCKLEKKYLNK